MDITSDIKKGKRDATCYMIIAEKSESVTLTIQREPKLAMCQEYSDTPFYGWCKPEGDTKYFVCGKFDNLRKANSYRIRYYGSYRLIPGSKSRGNILAQYCKNLPILSESKQA